MCFRPRTVLLGVATISEFIWGISPKTPQRGVNRQFQAKRAEYKNRDTLLNTLWTYVGLHIVQYYVHNNCGLMGTDYSMPGSSVLDLSGYRCG